VPVITALGRLRQEDYEFGANLGYIVSQKRKTKQKVYQLSDMFYCSI
jgi:hypothetical protein